ncbi:TetR/AcrR family transcriptional regulator [Pseudalkalibacillus berkeleyi]|uniref:TetR/AcrR family transcriptional regulator n=1 Tax=Pseudalkalibacillus berkeleyi TaxID=1069813 RepID=A0ABS9H0W6_9BACL|nr:TetR/AcrR family transcriptional regulator [Pseudalkalibacillus berkeleyi]MCF6138647.1 TetR/AcrR family transcriptional regulator [Pseudalkalibacillus berkeleyi]
MTSKKEHIISATAELIHAKGYESTKLSDILKAADIGKGQFYHYFSSKKDLGISVVDQYVQTWEQNLIEAILQSDKPSTDKLNEMLDWAVSYHESIGEFHGCPFGNLALEMSEHDEIFRTKINALFEKWIRSLENVLEDIVGGEKALMQAQAIVAQLEGGILLMKNFQDLSILRNIAENIRAQYI